MKYLELYENYCNKCEFILDTKEEEEICKYCQVLDILGKKVNAEEEYNMLKYLMGVKKVKVYDYIDSLQTKYNLTDEQVEKILNILKLN